MPREEMTREEARALVEPVPGAEQPDDGYVAGDPADDEDYDDGLVLDDDFEAEPRGDATAAAVEGEDEAIPPEELRAYALHLQEENARLAQENEEYKAKESVFPTIEEYAHAHADIEGDALRASYFEEKSLYQEDRNRVTRMEVVERQMVDHAPRSATVIAGLKQVWGVEIDPDDLVAGADKFEAFMQKRDDALLQSGEGRLLKRASRGWGEGKLHNAEPARQPTKRPETAAYDAAKEAVTKNPQDSQAWQRFIRAGRHLQGG